jgi:hypothetical protein
MKLRLFARRLTSPKEQFAGSPRPVEVAPVATSERSEGSDPIAAFAKPPEVEKVLRKHPELGVLQIRLREGFGSDLLVDIRGPLPVAYAPVSRGVANEVFDPAQPRKLFADWAPDVKLIKQIYEVVASMGKGGAGIVPTFREDFTIDGVGGPDRCADLDAGKAVWTWTSKLQTCPELRLEPPTRRDSPAARSVELIGSGKQPKVLRGDALVKYLIERAPIERARGLRREMTDDGRILMGHRQGGQALVWTRDGHFGIATKTEVDAWAITELKPRWWSWSSPKLPRDFELDTQALEDRMDALAADPKAFDKLWNIMRSGSPFTHRERSKIPVTFESGSAPPGKRSINPHSRSLAKNPHNSSRGDWRSWDLL